MKPQLKSIITKTKSWRLRRSTKAKCIIYKSHCGCHNHSWTVVQLISVKIGRSGTLISHMNLKKHHVITVNKGKMYNLQSHCGCHNHSWTVVQLISVKIGRSGTLISHMNLKKHHIITVNRLNLAHFFLNKTYKLPKILFAINDNRS